MFAFGILNHVLANLLSTLWTWRAQKCANALLLGFTLLLGEVASATPVCDAAIAPEISKSREIIERDVMNSRGTVDSLSVTLENVKLIRFLGEGVSGWVYEVERNGKRLALKMMKSWVFKNEDLRGIAIQKHLGDLGIAPQLEGVVFHDAIASFIRQNRFRLAFGAGKVSRTRDVNIGVLMELTPANSLGRRWDDRKAVVTKTELNQLKAQALSYLKIFTELNIAPWDIDSVVIRPPEGGVKLMLIDTLFYRLGPFNQAEAEKYLLDQIKANLEVAAD